MRRLADVETELKCMCCGAVLGDSPPSLGRIMTDCGSNALPYIQAKLLIDKYGWANVSLLCNDCFWMFGKKEPRNKIKEWVEQNPEQTRHFLLAISIVLLLVAILTFGGGIYMTMSGWHSLDLAQDMNSLTLQLGHDPADIKECNLGKECFDLQTTYLDGALRMFQGIKLAIFTAFLIPIITFAVVALAQKNDGGNKW